MWHAPRHLIGRAARQLSAAVIVAASAVALQVSGFGASAYSVFSRGFERALQQDETQRVWAAQPTGELYRPVVHKSDGQALLRRLSGAAPAFWPQQARVGDRFTLAGPGGDPETLEVDDVQLLDAATASPHSPRLMIVTARVVGRIAAPVRFVVEARDKSATAQPPERL